MVGLAIVAPGVVAHALAGGHIPLLPVSLAVLAAIAVGTVLRPTFWRVLLVAIGAQPAVHFALMAGHPSGHDAHAHHAGVGHAHTIPAHADTRMVVAHLAGLLVTAVALRWGARWLRTLPAIARAFVTPRPAWATPIVGNGRSGGVRSGADLVYEAELHTRSNRGPPRRG